MEKDYKYLVCTRCYTFNQAEYIVDAMNGFTMQKTTLPVVTTIVDDASTDGEPEVIKNYLMKHFQEPYREEETEDAQIICAKHKTNPNCEFVVFLLKYNHYKKKSKLLYLLEWLENAKYLALCEGDDYWIDPLKLQKEVSFLNDNPEFGLIYTNHYNRKGDEITKFHEKGYTTFEELLISSGIGTLTACFRIDLYFKYIQEIQPREQKWMMGDAPLWKYMAYNSKIKFIPDYTAVYRVLETSASHFTSSEKRIAFINSGYDVQTFFINKYVIEQTKKEALMRVARDNRNKSIINAYVDCKEYKKLKLFLMGHCRNIKFKEKVRIVLKYIYSKALR